MRERIAVLGGGIGALSAVHALTSEPGWADRYEITVYQMGWRLGGKAASSRTPDGRIVEHGLHVWFGFYERAFRMIRDVYAELGRPPDHPLATWDKAFSPASLVVVHQTGADGRPDPWPLDYPRNARVPGDPWLAGPADLVRSLAGWIRTTIEMAFRTAEPGRRRDVASRLAFGTVASWLHTLDAVAIGRARGVVRERLAKTARRRREWERLWIPLDLGLTALYGIVRDDLVRRGFSAIDHLDLREWLLSHGASRLSVDSPVMRAAYIAGFAYEDACLDRPECAAGALMQGVLRLMFSYNGAYMWRMNAGMGETVITPLYEVLARRGVAFRFFHRVDELVPEGDRIAAIRMGRQARPKPSWRPLVDVGGVACWPAEPDWTALEGGDVLRERGAKCLESNAHPCPAADEVVLRDGVDFDRVILGIPIGALPRVARRLRADPRWADALDHASTTATFSAQLWLDQPSDQLGWPRTSRSRELPLYGGAVGWVDTWADMSHLGAFEGWSADERSVHYLCGPWPDDGREPDLDAWLAGPARALWPGLRPEAVAASHVQVNEEPSERYVLTPPGSVKYRLAPDGSGLANLALCGDWTKNGVDLGCIEAAVTSGVLCARAVRETRPSPALTADS